MNVFTATAGVTGRGSEPSDVTSLGASFPVSSGFVRILELGIAVGEVDGSVAVDNSCKGFRPLDGDITRHIIISSAALYSSMKAQHQQHIFIRNVGFHERWLPEELCSQ